MGRNGLKITHLMFTDDLLLFSEATKEQAKCVMNCINTFCDMSGQKVSKNI